ncbi:MAG: LamG domain-containing protein [Flavobacteriales bacterium]|nr:LamG domain-containing protein [Flavobacteriales bacterium]
MKNHYSLAKVLFVNLLVSISTSLFAQDRVADDLLVLYNFGEGNGVYVHDISGVGTPLTMKILDGSSTNWLPGGGLEITAPSLVQSFAQADKVYEACTQSNAISMECWVIPDNNNQSGPARIMTVSYGSSNRNCMLGQNGNKYAARVRTTQTNDNGTPTTNANGLSAQLQHVVYTRNAAGVEKCYINGVEVVSDTRSGNFSNWDIDYKLAFANEINGDSPWLGTLHLAAMYSEALSAEQVQQNYNAGHLIEGPEISTELCSEEDCFLDGYGDVTRAIWLPGLPNGAFIEFEFDENGGFMDVFADGTAHMYGQTFDKEDPSKGFFMDMWFSDRMNWDEWSALGRGWKGDPAIVQDHYTEWDYYIMDPDVESKLIGTGDYDGDVLFLTHRPSNYFYGLQVGVAANDKNELPGMSCWFDYSGSVAGQDLVFHGDINLEGDCVNLPVMECAVDVEVSCEEGIDPETTGYPTINCPDVYDLTYTDEVTQNGCELTITRSWTATHNEGTLVLCDQTITVIDTTAPVVLASVPLIATDCNSTPDFSALVVDECDSNPAVEYTPLDTVWIDGQDCANAQLRTQTPGGWGAPPNGNNPGMYLHQHFNAAFPNGLTIGCNNTLTLTNAQAVTDFLPSGTTPTTLPAGDLVDPAGGYSNVFAGHLVALTLSVTFDNMDSGFGASDLALEDMVLQSGSFQGMTVGALLQLANEAIGGCLDYDYPAISSALASCNENYVDGTTNQGFLGCSYGFDCAVLVNMGIVATDACGNQSEAEVSVIYPMEGWDPFNGLEENITVSCDEIPEPVSIDECFSNWVDFSVVETQFSGTCFPTIQRVYSWTAPCGGAGEFTQYIVVIDEVAPEFVSLPQDVETDCNGLAALPEPQATDNCSDVIMGYDDVVVNEGCPMVIQRTWTAMDGCGNTANAVQFITLTDNDPPVPTIDLFDMEVACDDPMPTPDFIDACGGLVTVDYSESTSGDPCAHVVQRSWTVTDACGNQAVYEQQIIVIDNQSPIFTFVPQDVVLECGEAFPSEEPMTVDNCSSVALVYEIIPILNGNNCEEWMETWTAQDACGNTSVATRSISVVDTEAPVFTTVVEDVALSCGDELPVVDVTATDNCSDNVQIDYMETITVVDCVVMHTRTWTATDDCGNTAEMQQVVSMTDNAAPVISGDEVVVTDCNAVAEGVFIEVLDDCLEGVEITYVDNITGSGCAYEISREWIAVDACGNTATFMQLIQVVDDSAPELTLSQESIELNCGDPTPEAEVPVVEDCGEVELTLSEQWVEGLCGDQLIRTWLAVDACGNQSSINQLINFNDNTAPVFVASFSDQVLPCGADLPAVPNVSATDDCSSVEITFTEAEVAGACSNLMNVVRTWVATDACGNIAVVSQTITFVDNTPPVFDQDVPDVTINCGDQAEMPVVTASDDCGSVVIEFQETTSPGGCPNLTRVWTAIDGCGNQAMMVQHVTVDDSEPPLLLGIPDDVVADCNSIPDMPDPEVSDNCDDDVSVTVSENVVGTGCEYTIIRTWVAQDDCGNTTIASYSITVEDTQPPVFVDAPAEVWVDCSELDAMNYPEVFDDCAATVNITYEDTPLGSGCAYDVLRVYTAADQCGNMATAEQLLHVSDQTPPYFVGVSGNIYVSCNNIPDPQDVQVLDACSEVVDVVFSEQQFGAGCSYHLQRTWTATDACGNAASISHLVYVSDTQGPVLIGVPDDIVLSCNDEVPAAPNVGATDDCSPSVAVNMVQFSETNDCETIFTRIWTATDDCGNTTNAVRQVILTDTEAPVWSNVPASIEANCGAIPDPVAPVATDNCDGDVNIAYSEGYTFGECPYTIIRTWTATDNCGNSAQVTQEVLVNDSEAPVLSLYPADVETECGNLPEAPVVTATDNCAENVPVMMVETWESTSSCVNILYRTWIAEDLCGNVVEHTQMITLVDTTAPVFLNIPEDLVVECQDVPAMEFLEVDDDCSVPELVMMTDTVLGTCPGTFTIYRFWGATDACGNVSTVAQVIEVVDESAPELSDYPADTTVACGNIPAIPQMIAFDGCSDTLAVSFNEEIIGMVGDTSTCDLGNAEALAGDIALWLPNLAGLGSNYIFGEAGGTITRDLLNGTAHITGQVYNPDNANESWILDMYLYDEMDWQVWAENGGSYKDDFDVAGDAYLDWSYFKLSDASRLIGAGDFAGSELNLTHAPSDFTFGFQLGLAANNRNDAFGMSGWFFYNGVINGQVVDGVGDLMTENNCCEDHDIVRTWSVTDCSGNTTTWTQVIHVVNAFEFPALYYPPLPGSLIVSEQANGEYLITFVSPFSGRSRLDVLDLSGNVVDVIYEGEVAYKQAYTFDYQPQMSYGLYFFRMHGEGEKFVQKTIVQ